MPKCSFAFATAQASFARSSAGTDTWRRLMPSPNASLQLLLLNSSAMYNTGADALSSFLRATGFLSGSPSLVETVTRG